MARVGFLGSPEPAADCLRALVDAGHDVAIAVTEPDKRRSRGSATSPTAVKRSAIELGIPVTDRIADVLGVGADLGVVVAFGRLIPAAVLDRLLMVNVHFSLLPRWRGAAPVERAILAGDDVTGVCLMQLDAGLDTGPVYACTELAILAGETAASLRKRLSTLGAELLVARLVGGVSSLGTAISQVGEPTYAAKLTPSELHIDWARPAVEIERLIRVGRAWTTIRHRRMIVWGSVTSAGPATAAGAVAPGTLLDGLVATADGWLELCIVQVEGRRRQNASEWLRGARIAPGEAFS